MYIRKIRFAKGNFRQTATSFMLGRQTDSNKLHVRQCQTREPEQRCAPRPAGRLKRESNFDLFPIFL